LKRERTKRRRKKKVGPARKEKEAVKPKEGQQGPYRKTL